MRILVLNYEYPPVGGGAKTVCSNLAREMVRLGHTVDVVTMWFHGLKRFEVIDGVNVHRVPCLRKKAEVCHTREMLSYCVTAIPKVLSLHKKRHYAINHTHFIFPTGLVAYVLKKLTGLEYLITAHGSDVQGYNPDRFKLDHSLLKPLWRAIADSSAMITSPSGSLRELILGHRKALPVHVVPNAVDEQFFSPGQTRKKAILTSGRLLPRKGIQYLIEAMSAIESDFETIVLGDGPFRRQLEELARQKHVNARFVGWLDHSSPEFRELYRSSAVFVLPSEMENFSMSLLEAMACGTAIITTNAGGCLEVVDDCALVVAPRDVTGLRQKLQQLLSDERLRSELGRKARKRVEDHFTWRVVAQQYEALFNRVREGRARA